MTELPAPQPAAVAEPERRLVYNPLVAVGLTFAVMVALGCTVYVAAHHLMFAVVVWAPSCS